jgi:hypothetical protein
MAGTRNQIDSSVSGRRARSLLRDDRTPAGQGSNDKRPAGPSSHSDPGMGSPTRPLPPGKTGSVTSTFVRHPKIAGSFRSDPGSILETTEADEDR